MKQEEVKKKENKKGKMVKRQVSIITVFLWIFLIAVMSIITLNSIKKKSALEIIDDNWNIGLVMYDRSSDTPNEAITDFTWNAISEYENHTYVKKELVMQINYNCTTGKVYNPGEIIIEIPGISKDSFSENNSADYNYNNWLAGNVAVSADEVNADTKYEDWSYSYNKENNIYTFTNNEILSENEHFEGTIQIVYELVPKLKAQIDYNYKAKLKENIVNASEIIAVESNICSIHYTAKKMEYDLSIKGVATIKENSKIKDILDDYYWVKYNYECSDSDSGIIRSFDINNLIFGHYFNRASNSCIKTVLPDGCVIYNYDFDKLEEKEKNTYYYLQLEKDYYVGYPKSRYNEGDKITNTAELWGRYEDEEEIQKLSEVSNEVFLVNFDFEYTGKLYSVMKGAPESRYYMNKIENNGDTNTWKMNAIAFYTDSKMDVEIGDDLLYITRENGEVTKLEDNEFNFTKISVPVFFTYDKYNKNEGEALIGYKYEIQVRYKDTNNWVVYKEGITTDEKINQDYGIQNICEFERDDVVGVKVVIKDLDKTLYSKGVNNIYSYCIRPTINIHTKNCGLGNIYNFNFLNVYKKDENGNKTLENIPTLDNYNTLSTKLHIAENDINIYGRYMQRDYADTIINNGEMILDNGKYFQKLYSNRNEKQYESMLHLDNSLIFRNIDVNKDCIIKTYDVLPSGMYIENTKEDIIESITSNLPYKNLKLKDGTKFNNEEEFNEFLKENTTIDIDYNYKYIGKIRTKITITYNLNEIDWSYYLTNEGEGKISISLNTKVPYDSILEYGTRYENNVESMWNNQEYSYYYNHIDMI